jgi:curved DNA-binding protein CbpA
MLKKIEDMNYYELLEVSSRATAQEIHKAYERIRRIYDPNSVALYSLFSPEETEKIRQRIEEAYRTLIYDENRREYDLSIRDLAALLPAEQQPRPTGAPLLRRPQREEHRTRPPMSAPFPDAAKVPRPTSPRPVPHASESLVPPIQPPPADIREFTGPVLKIMREQRQLSVQNISDITKLSNRYVEGIEEEDYLKLPVRPYLRGFLILYCRAIGYEPERIVADYMKRYDLTRNPPKK